MKILAVYLAVVNLILFGACAKNDKNSDLLIQSVLYFMPTLILIMYTIIRA